MRKFLILCISTILLFSLASCKKVNVKYELKEAVNEVSKDVYESKLFEYMDLMGQTFKIHSIYEDESFTELAPETGLKGSEKSSQTKNINLEVDVTNNIINLKYECEGGHKGKGELKGSGSFKTKLDHTFQTLNGETYYLNNITNKAVKNRYTHMSNYTEQLMREGYFIKPIGDFSLNTDVKYYNDNGVLTLKVKYEHNSFENISKYSTEDIYQVSMNGNKLEIYRLTLINNRYIAAFVTTEKTERKQFDVYEPIKSNLTAKDISKYSVSDYLKENLN